MAPDAASLRSECAESAGMTSTAHVAVRRSFVVTLPTMSRVTNPWPWLPVAMRSAPARAAYDSNSRAGSPVRMTSFTRTPCGTVRRARESIQRPTHVANVVFLARPTRRRANAHAE